MFHAPKIWQSTLMLVFGQLFLLANACNLSAQDSEPSAEVNPTSASTSGAEASTTNAVGEAGASGEAAVAEGVAMDGGAGGLLGQFFANPLNLILLSAILFMFIVVRPQQRKYKELQKAMAALKKNDRVVTASGIHGTVVQVSPESATVSIRIDENSGARMTVNRDAIASIVEPESNKKAGSN